MLRSGFLDEVLDAGVHVDDGAAPGRARVQRCAGSKKVKLRHGKARLENPSIDPNIVAAADKSGFGG
jgi:hypothetical protein